MMIERAIIHLKQSCSATQAPVNRSGAGAAVGLDDVAIHRDLLLADGVQVDHRAERAADQALDLLRAARRLAGVDLAAGAGPRGSHAGAWRIPP